MGNAGFLENRADADETQLLVETDDGNLSVEINLPRAKTSRRSHRLFEQLRPNALMSK